MDAILALFVLLGAIGVMVVRWRKQPPLSRHVASSPVVKLVRELIVEAVDARATEIHVASVGSEGSQEVTYTVDGEVRPVATTPAPLGAHVIRRLKILSRGRPCR